MIAKLKHYTNKNTLKLIYYALVYPYLTYGNLVWGNTYRTRLQILLKIQKKIVRLIQIIQNLYFLILKSWISTKLMIIFAVYLCIAAWIIIKICQTFTIITLFKIKNCIIIIRETFQNCTFVIKGRTVVFTLFLTREFPYGIVLIKKLKIKNRIFPLRKKQN
jgi:hypothetical protein